MTEIACQHCGKAFTPVRVTARFCSDRCRVAASRAKGSPPPAMEGPASAAGAGTGEVLSVTGTLGTPGAATAPAVTLRRLPNLPAGIVQDENHAGMYRVRRPDGSLSDMVNLTRAVDALRVQQDREAVKRREAA
jgi:hypothetical protein